MSTNISICCTCWHKWRSGQDGSHICSVRLKSALEEVTQQRDELLAALEALEFESSVFAKGIPAYGNSEPLAQARSAIAKAKDKK